MTKQVHVVSTDALGTLGTIIDETGARDAVHLAVEPAIAAETLYPGQHVSFSGGKAKLGGKPVGVVDPFLTSAVHAGQRFWLVVYPRTITSLRHVWEHPAFGQPATATNAVDARKSASEKWMREWAVRHMAYDYYGDGDKSEDAAYSSAIDAGRDMHIGPYESARDYIDDEWWTHWEAITGEVGQRGEYFSCAC